MNLQNSKNPIPLEVQLLGALTVRVHGNPLARLRSRQGQWLLALLVLRHNRETERDWLASLLWPDSGAQQALYNLRRNLTDLRHALGPEAGRLSPSYSRMIRLDLTGAEVDVTAFDAAIERGDTASLEQAVELYRGELLEGCREDWILPEREARAQAHLQALERLAAHFLACHDPDAAARCLRRILAADPLRETALRALMEALAARGEYAAMTQTYRDFRLYLYRELNTEPAEETTALYRDLKLQEHASLAGTTSSPMLLRSLPLPLSELIGRDLEVEDLLACLKATRLLTLIGVGGIGKTRLAVAVAAAAENYAAGVRFVDLSPLADPALIASAIATALGITEKSDLGLLEEISETLQTKQLLLVLDNCEHLIEGCADVVGSLLSHCPDLHILATSRQPLGLAGEVAWRVPSLSFPFPSRNATRVRAGAENSHGEKDQIAILMEYSAIRLFWDRARQTRPDIRMTLSEVEIVATICRRLDGIPLAIELAAARARALSIAEIDARLEDRFRLLTSGASGARPRHQTLQASIDWSYNLLSAQEKRLLQRLSVFAGGWTLEAAEAVCSGPGEEEGERKKEKVGEDSLSPFSFFLFPEEVLDLLTSLVDKSLVVYTEQGERAWYRLLETVRQYSHERIAECGGEAELRQRHAAYYLALVEQAEAEIMGPAQESWLARLEREHDNLRAAMNWCQESDTEPERTTRLEMGLKLASGLWRFWWLRGHLSEGRERLLSMLKLHGTDHPTGEVAKALCGAGNLAQCQGGYAQAAVLFEQALALEHALGNKKGEAGVLFYLGDLASNQGDYASARSLLERSLAIQREMADLHAEAECLSRLGYIAREQGELAAACSLMEAALAIHIDTGDRMSRAWNLGSLGYVYHAQGDNERADAAFTQTLAIYRAFGNRSGEAWSLASLAFIACERSDYVSAKALLEEALLINRELDNPAGEAWNLSLRARALRGLGEHREALAALESALTINRRIGSRKMEAENLRHLGDVFLDWGDLAMARHYFDMAMRLMQVLQLKSDLAGLLEAYGELAVMADRPERAACLWGAAQALREALDKPLPFDSKERHERHLRAAGKTLGETVFTRCWAAGQRMTLEQAVEYALEAEGIDPRAD